MKPAQWWMRIVGAFYLFEGIGLALMAAFVPSQFAELWATAEPGSLSEVAVRGTLVAGMPGVLTWVLFGTMLWMHSGAPARARLLLVTVIAWELLVWLPLDLIGFFNGFEAGRAAGLIVTHAIIGIAGILALRRLPREV